jgi:biopolymer transport protein ExbB/TolQ
VIVAIIVFALIAYMASRSRAKQVEEKRIEAREHREAADTTAREADKAKLQAEERAAQARRQQMEAEEQAEKARAKQSEAEELRQHADEIDPDTEPASEADAPVESEARRER